MRTGYDIMTEILRQEETRLLSELEAIRQNFQPR